MTEEQARRIQSGVTPEAAELGLWFLSIRSFLVPRNHPRGDVEEAAERDYRCETLVLREVLLRSLHLIANVAGEESANRRAVETGSGRELRRVFLPSPPSLEGESLAELAEQLKAVGSRCEAAAESDAVGLGAWGDLGTALIRVLDDSAAARSLAEAARAPRTGPTRERLASLAGKVSPEASGEELLLVFDGFARLLDHLAFAGRALAADAPLKSLLVVFALVRDESREVLDLSEQLSRAEVAPPPVGGALDGTAYAVRMELRKAFEQELAGFCAIPNPAQTFSRAESACGLLRNCFQQSVVALAQAVDPTIKGHDLFDSFQTRLDESLSVRGELWGLIQFAHEAERSPPDNLNSVVERLSAFRDWSLRYLMYKDREPFERFLEEVESARGGVALTEVLHRLGAFLETLFGQVNMRAALVGHPFNPDETDRHGAWQTPSE